MCYLAIIESFRHEYKTNPVVTIILEWMITHLSQAISLSMKWKCYILAVSLICLVLVLQTITCQMLSHSGMFTAGQQVKLTSKHVAKINDC